MSVASELINQSISWIEERRTLVAAW